jgi:hypothetical protein
MTPCARGSYVTDCNVERVLEEVVLERVDVGTGPLFRMWLIICGPRDHLLVVAMEHIISDAASLTILLRDLFTSYAQLTAGRGICLPPIKLQFPEYATVQWAQSGSWIQTHRVYWNDCLGTFQGARFRRTPEPQTEGRVGWTRIPIRLGSQRANRLREWCRRYRTTIALFVFAMYSALVLRWCRISTALFQYQSDGRFSSDIDNTIGFFATMLYLRVELRDSDRLIEVVDRVKEKYCNAHQHADQSFLETQYPRPEFTRAVGFNWIPRNTSEGQSVSVRVTDDLDYVSVPVTDIWLKALEADGEPILILNETDEDILGGLYFPSSGFAAREMAAFLRSFDIWVAGMLLDTNAKVLDQEVDYQGYRPWET